MPSSSRTILRHIHPEVLRRHPLLHSHLLSLRSASTSLSILLSHLRLLLFAAWEEASSSDALATCTCNPQQLVFQEPPHNEFRAELGQAETGTDFLRDKAQAR